MKDTGVDRNGIFVAIGAEDPSDADHHINMLAQRLQKHGHRVWVADFSKNDENSYFIRQLESGAYGDPSLASPYFLSLVYDLGLLDKKAQILDELKKGNVVLASSFFIAAVMNPRGARLGTPEEQRGYYLWEDAIRHQVLGLPRPDTTIILETRPNDMYLDIERLFPKDFQVISCYRNGNQMSKPQIQKLIYERVSPLVPFSQKMNTPSDSAPAPTTAEERFERSLLIYLRRIHPNQLAEEMASDISAAILPIDKAINPKKSEILSAVSKTFSDDHTVLRLIKSNPRNELDSLPELQYPINNLSVPELTKQISRWEYEAKVKAFRQLINADLSVLTYNFEVLSSYQTFEEIQRLNISKLSIQQPSQRYGFDVPEAVEQAGLSEQYEAFFDTSYKTGVVLRGHRVRYTLACNGNQLLEILRFLSRSSRPECQELKKLVIDKASEAHPLTMQLVGERLTK